MKIGLLGLGTVGSGVIEILRERREELKNLTGEDIVIEKILVRNMEKKREVEIDPDILTNDFQDILASDIDIIVELTGDLESGYKYIKEGIKFKKHIVTANKAVVSKYFEDLSQRADKSGVAFLYESSVAGGIPIIKPLLEAGYLNDIDMVQGILNGTCNYILTRMVEENKAYDEVLAIAQELGYAEADPTEDVGGYDSLRKLRILSSLAFKGQVREEDILLFGIDKIKKVDIENIKSLDATVKLIGEAVKLGGGFRAVVQPMVVKNDSYFANVKLAYNSVAFRGNNVEKLKFYGPGAGKLPTANAVLSDILDIVLNTYRKGNPLGENKLENLNLDIGSEYYLRISRPSQDLKDELSKIKRLDLSYDRDLAFITSQVKLGIIEEIIKKHKVKEEEYFLAKVLD